VGPYSQAVRAGKFLFVSGQIPLDPKDCTVHGKTAADQATQVMENLRHLLEDAGTTLKRVLKTTIYLANMEDFDTINEVYGLYFTEPYPARTTVQVSRLPRDVLIEMDAIALV
jgi:2-iminobutanoate/2-iminopropanoate deaminase